MILLLLLCFSLCKNQLNFTVSQLPSEPERANIKLLSNYEFSKKIQNIFNLSTNHNLASKTKFSNLIHSSTKLNQEDIQKIVINNENWEKSHESFAIEIIFVKNCNFINCKFPNAQGGAILSLNHLEIDNSYFSKCYSLSGGSIACMSNLIIKQSKFSDSFAKRGGAVFHQFGHVSLSQTLFVSCASTNIGGSIFSSNILSHKSENTNYSSSSCAEDASAASIENGDIKISYNILANCHLRRGTGGFLIREASGLIKNSIFTKNRFDDIVGGGASSIELTGRKGLIIIQKNYFFSTSAFNYWSIRGREFINSEISFCTFTNDEKTEINMKHSKVENCLFNVTKFSTQIPVFNDKIQKPVDKPQLYQSYASIFAFTGKVILPFVITVLILLELIDFIKIMKLRKKSIE